MKCKPSNALWRENHRSRSCSARQALGRCATHVQYLVAVHNPDQNITLQTALLREILSHPRYHVLHFDLRIAGFADIESLYTSLSIQMEGYFEELANKGGWYEEGSSEPVKLSDSEIEAEGWDAFEAEALAFKHERINIQRRAGPDGEGVKYEVRPSDIARLMELFQSSLLRYREFVPGSSSNKGKHRRQASEDTVVEGRHSRSSSSGKRWFFSRRHERYVSPEPEEEKPNDAIDEERRKKRVKRVPVSFSCTFKGDEAHLWTDRFCSSMKPTNCEFMKPRTFV